MGFSVVVDSREQRPWEFPGVPTEVRKLEAGDYSVAGLEARVALERKSLVDLYGTVGRGRNRFERELELLSKLDFSAIVIEADLFAIVRRPPRRSRLSPKAVIRSLVAWSQRYGVHVLPAGSRELAQRMALIILERFYVDVREGKR